MQLREEIQSLRKELSFERQLNEIDNPRHGSVGDTDIHHTTRDTTLLPQKKSTFSAQMDTNEDIVRPDDGSVDSINGSDNEQRDANESSYEIDTKPLITDLLMSGPDSRCNTLFGQLFKSNEDLRPHVRTHVTDDHIQTSITRKSKFRFKCLAEECDHRFIAKITLIEHMLNSHRIEDTYECNDCDAVCLTTDEIIKHRHREHEMKTVVSTRESCGESFDSNGYTALRQHIQDIPTTSGQQSLGEELLDFDGFNRSDGVIAGQNVTTITTHETRNSGRRKRRANSGKPSKQSKRTKQLYCDYNGCHRVFGDARDLERHRFTHSADKPFKCTVNGCLYSCITKYQLERHMNRHLGIRPYVCTHEGCGKRFTRNDALQQHVVREGHRLVLTSGLMSMVKVNKVVVQVLREEIQSLRKELSFEKQLNEIDNPRHGSVGDTDIHHTSITPIGRPLKRPTVETLTQDTSEDTEISDAEPIDDSNDGQHFVTKSRVRAHVTGGHTITSTARQESALKPKITVKRPVMRGFQCDYEGCRRVCSNSSTLRIHRLTHSTDKPHKCPVNDCRYQCIRFRELRNHLNNKHNGLHLHPCPHDSCGQLFLTAEELAQHHIDCHLPTDAVPEPLAKVFACDFIGCERTFSTQRDQTFHQLTHAGDNGEQPLGSVGDTVIGESTVTQIGRQLPKPRGRPPKWSIPLTQTYGTSEGTEISDAIPIDDSIGDRDSDEASNESETKRSHKTKCQYKCAVNTCDKRFETQEEYFKHLDQIHCTYRCNDCNLGFLTPHYVSLHRKTCPKKPLITTQDLNVGIESSKTSLAKSGEIVCRYKDYKSCPKCSKSFHTERQLSAHKELCQYIEKSLVKTCDKRFATQEEYYKHLDQIHCTYRCNDCKLGFLTQLLLTKHGKLCPKKPSLGLIVQQSVITTQDLSVGIESSKTSLAKSDETVSRLKHKDNNLCPKCSKSLQNEKHKKSCQYIQKCSINTCNQWFKTPEEYHKHLDDIHLRYGCNSLQNEKHKKSCQYIQKCSINTCNQWFKTPEEYHKHLDDIHLRYGCNVCRKRFLTQEMLAKHQSNCPPPPPTNQCRTCGQRFDTTDEYHRHLSETHYKYKCAKCPQLFAKPELLSDHEWICGREPPYVCTHEGCGKEFRDKHVFVKHRLRHTTDRPFACDYQNCDKRFKSEQHVREHKRVVHFRRKPQFRNFRCPKQGCGRAFYCASGLWGHLNGVHSTREYWCDWPDCQYRTHSQSLIGQHRRRHNLKKCQKIACDWPACEYRTYSRHLLRGHLRSHSTDRPHACHWPGCDHKSKTSTGLAAHLVYHSGPDIACDVKGCHKLLINDLVEELREEIQSLRKELSFERQLNEIDNPRLGSVGDIDIRESTVAPIGQQLPKPRGRPPKWSIPLTQTHGTSEGTEISEAEPIDDSNDGRDSDNESDAKRSHEMKDQYKCSVHACDQRFATQEEYYKHMDQIHCTYRCKDCNLGFLTQLLISKHRIKCPKRPLITTRNPSVGIDSSKTSLAKSGETVSRLKHKDNNLCPKCSKSLQNEKHKKTCQYIQKCSINTCDQWFKTLEEYHKHLDDIHLRYGCNVCRKKFLTRELLSKHQTNCPPTKSTKQCMTCGQRFHTTDEYHRHLSETHYKYKCAKCPQIFAKPELLSDHEWVCGCKPPYVCTHEGCGKEFRDKYDFIQHRLKHTTVRPFACDYQNCDKRFKSEQHLRQHKRNMHSGVSRKPQFRTFRCPKQDCGRAFHWASALWGHMNGVHSTREYRCDWPDCQHRTHSQELMKRHRLRHSQKKYQKMTCDWPACEYRTYSRGLLRCHMRSHSTDRPHACHWPGCEHKFKTTSGLRNHMVFHSGPDIACDVKGCQFSTKYKQNLYTHKKTLFMAKEFVKIKVERRDPKSSQRVVI
ncbi:unnamed protein product [Medioppia subpectinata]|uniref:C2H2-type domain-containing protein n=1 Tax=Medioppia subpectinata TaxID=1979941 RepID=A0A7R9KNU2_9ACAR|nr:unnamed protein product [Medioppia subpectinata]CAG2106010.1 unnamed protein product [Medioppia subpectinata]